MFFYHYISCIAGVTLKEAEIKFKEMKGPHLAKFLAFTGLVAREYILNFEDNNIVKCQLETSQGTKIYEISKDVGTWYLCTVELNLRAMIY